MVLKGISLKNKFSNDKFYVHGEQFSDFGFIPNRKNVADFKERHGYKYGFNVKIYETAIKFNKTSY